MDGAVRKYVPNAKKEKNHYLPYLQNFRLKPEAHIFFLFGLKVVPVPGDIISLPLFESRESCESLLQVEWQPDHSPQQNIFSLDYGMQVDIMC